MLTGRDLIIYILQNDLENEPVFLDSGFLNLLTEAEAATKFNVGVPTIKVWYERGLIKGIRVGDKIYILPKGE